MRLFDHRRVKAAFTQKPHNRRDPLTIQVCCGNRRFGFINMAVDLDRNTTRIFTRQAINERAQDSLVSWKRRAR